MKEDSFVKELKNLIQNGGSNVDAFCKLWHILYGDFSDQTAYRIPFPAIIMENVIDEILKLIGIFGDKSIKTTIRVSVTPLNGLEGSDSSSFDVSLQ